MKTTTVQLLLLVRLPALWMTSTVFFVQFLNRIQGAAEAFRLAVENAVNRWLRGVKLDRDARLAPTRRRLDFPQKG